MKLLNTVPAKVSKKKEKINTFTAHRLDTRTTCTELHTAQTTTRNSCATAHTTQLIQLNKACELLAHCKHTNRLASKQPNPTGEEKEKGKNKQEEANKQQNQQTNTQRLFVHCGRASCCKEKTQELLG